MNKLVITLLSLVLSGPLLAAEIDKSASEFKWTGKKVTGQHYGTVPLKNATVSVKDGKVEKGDFILDISNLTVTDLTGEYKSKFLTHMKSGDFFEVSKWPTAKLQVERLDGKNAFGKLTIKGKTHPVQFPYTQKDNVFTGQLQFDRTKFDMIYGSGNFFKNLGDKMIYNDVTVDFKVKVDGLNKKLAQSN